MLLDGLPLSPPLHPARCLVLCDSGERSVSLGSVRVLGGWQAGRCFPIGRQPEDLMQ